VACHEVGELAKELLKAADYGRQSFHPNAAWRNELGDVLFSLACLANSTRIDLLRALGDAMTKYRMRLACRGKAGSE
jgi:NTP pyrophosphatase (non-canonical NTP hydrolase)